MILSKSNNQSAEKNLLFGQLCGQRNTQILHEFNPNAAFVFGSLYQRAHTSQQCRMLRRGRGVARPVRQNKIWTKNGVEMNDTKQRDNEKLERERRKKQ
jgi:hypothetical protein